LLRLALFVTSIDDTAVDVAGVPFVAAAELAFEAGVHKDLVLVDDRD
jgi:hypothetical protein